MQAAIQYSIGNCNVESTSIPICGKEDILVKVMVCGICGSDIRISRYGNARVKFPAILGHEISGVIAEKGSEVADFKVGDRVALGADIPCGNCEYCRDGYPNNCVVNLAIGYQYPGGFAEFVKIDRKVWDGGPFQRIPDHICFEEAALSEPLACAINGLEILPNRGKNSIAIIGAGVLGCIFTELACEFGYKRIFLVDIDQEKLVMVKKLGFFADEYCMCNKDTGKKLHELTYGKGVDVAIVACSDVSAQRLALDIVAKRGAINLFAGLPAGSSDLAFPSNIIHYNEIFLTGSHGSTPRQHSQALRLISEGKVNLKKLITHSFPLLQINEAFAVVGKSQTLKVVVKPQEK